MTGEKLVDGVLTSGLSQLNLRVEEVVRSDNGAGYGKRNPNSKLSHSTRACARTRVALLFCLLGSVSFELHGQVVRNELPYATRTDPTAERIYQGILTDLEAGKLVETAAGLFKLKTDFAGTQVAVGPRHQIETTLLADLWLSRIPPPTEIQASIQALDDHDSATLFRKVIRGEISREELIERGDQAWSAGDIKRASELWRTASRLFTLSSFPENKGATDDLIQLDVLKRETIAKIFTGRFREAEVALNRLQQQFPEATGKLAGRTGPYAVTLEELQEQIMKAGPSALLSSPDCHPSRVVRFDFVRKLWSTPVVTGDFSAAAIQPLQWQNVLLIQDVAGIRGLDLATGRPAWPVDAADEGSLFETRNSLPQRTTLRMVTDSGIITENLWVGRTGTAGFSKSIPLEQQQESRISALNLAAEGRLDWTMTPDGLAGGDTASERIFSGSPVVKGTRLYVPLRSDSPGRQLWLTCLDSETGNELWTREIAASLVAPTAGGVSPHDRLALHDGLLFWPIDGIAVCCIEPENGILQWISGVVPFEQSKSIAAISDSDIFLYENKAYITTHQGVAAFETWTGELLWEQLMEDPPRSLAGLHDGLLIAASPGIVAIDTTSGRREWRLERPDRNQPVCRPKIVGSTLFCAIGKDILSIQIPSGTLLQRDHFQSLFGNSAMGVTLAGTTLLVDEGDQLSAFEVQLSGSQP